MIHSNELRLRPRQAAITAALVLAVLSPSHLVADSDEPDERITHRTRVVCPTGDDCAKRLYLPNLRGGYLGVEMTSISDSLRAHFGAPSDAGVMIDEVLADGPAAAAGLAVGDIVTAVDGVAIESTGQLGRVIRRAEPGTVVSIAVIRDRRALTFEATLGERERAVFDMGSFVVPPVRISEALEGVDWSQIEVQVAEAMEGIEWESLLESSQALSAEALENALRGVGQMFDSSDWESFVERIESVDYDALEAKMDVLRERLQELEERLEARDRDE